MKKTILVLSFLVLTAMPVSAIVTGSSGIDCNNLPTCSDLGFTDYTSSCPDNVIKCSLDPTMGKCLIGPTIGELKYSLQEINHDGWLLCDGKAYKRNTYSKLYGVIGTDYGSTTSTDFRVPDYRGYFLRGYGEATDIRNPLKEFSGAPNSSLKVPQKEQLPNVTGAFAADGNGNDDNSTVTKANVTHPYSVGHKFPSGPFKFGRVDGIRGPADTGDGGIVEFSLGLGNSIYTGSHVIPANYAANIFIYAGE